MSKEMIHSRKKPPSHIEIQPNTEQRSEGSSAKLESSKYVYELINGWIENADNKVNTSCAIFTGVFGIVSFLAEKSTKASFDKPITNKYWMYTHEVSFICSFLALALAVLFYAIAIYPNLKSVGKKKKYPIYFGDIRSLDFEEYKKQMIKSTDADFIDELILESWVNSGICMKKMKRYRVGIIMSVIAIGLAFLSFGSHFLMCR